MCHCRLCNCWYLNCCKGYVGTGCVCCCVGCIMNSPVRQNRENAQFMVDRIGCCSFLCGKPISAGRCCYHFLGFGWLAPDFSCLIEPVAGLVDEEQERPITSELANLNNRA